jgi:hypothetical protein
MKKTAPKKMTLSRETLRRLTEEQAKAAQGGLFVERDPPWTSDSQKICCA